MSDDSLEDFLDTLAGPKAATPDPASFETTDDLASFLPTPKHKPSAPDVETRAALIRQAFPKAHQTHLSELAEEASEAIVLFVTDPKRPHREWALFDLVLTHGYVTAALLAQVERPDGKRGYKEVAPRDIRKEGIVFDTKWMNGEMRYYLNVQESNLTLGGKDHITPSLRRAVFQRDNCTCQHCGAQYGSNALNADHIVPHRVAGKTDALTPDDLWTLCLSCNRKKQKACRTCPVQTGSGADPRLDCTSCLFSNPDGYTHVATRPERHLRIVARTPDEIESLEKVTACARTLGLS